MRNFFMQKKGGAAIEYLLVSTFATLTTIAILGLLSKIAQEKIEHLTEKTSQQEAWLELFDTES